MGHFRPRKVSKHYSSLLSKHRRSVDHVRFKSQGQFCSSRPMETRTGRKSCPAQRTTHTMFTYRQQGTYKLFNIELFKIKITLFNLISPKCDLMERIENWDDLDKFCRDNKFSGFFFASAKTGANVNESVHCLVEQARKLLIKISS